MWVEANKHHCMMVCRGVTKRHEATCVFPVVGIDDIRLNGTNFNQSSHICSLTCCHIVDRRRIVVVFNVLFRNRLARPREQQPCGLGDSRSGASCSLSSRPNRHQTKALVVSTEGTCVIARRGSQTNTLLIAEVRITLFAGNGRLAQNYGN
jgi:hypothetical protein